MVRFEISECNPSSVARLCEELAISDALAQVLVRRGYNEVADAQAFLAADEQHPLEAFDGLSDAAELIVKYARAGRAITIHGDYDVDGVCSTAVLVRTLRALGAEVDWYLPDRVEDGYGLNVATVRRLAERGTQLLLTVDCGITAVEEVALARSLGLEVIVSDHHLPRADGELPDALIVHPLLGGYPCSELCAAAVAYKLAQATLTAAGCDPCRVEEDLDLVALATIADVVPLLGENRGIVRRGLRSLAGTGKPGLLALMAVARVEPAKVNERAVGFGLAPRINAAGRLYRADAALELILCKDPVRAAQIADELDRANSERRQAELAIRLQAEAQIAELDGGDGRSAFVLAGEDWHRGVIGIVASRLAERHRRPVVLVSLEGERARGSGRSIEGYDLLGGLTSCAEHLVRYGGHSAAAGVELARDELPAFARALDRHAGLALGPDDLIESERVDVLLDGERLGMELAEELSRLAPFGKGNPSVSLMLADTASVRDVRSMGEGKHARFTIHSGGIHARAVAFGNDGRLGVQEGEPIEATFTLEVNEWKGVSEPRLVLRHIQALGQPPELEPRVDAVEPTVYAIEPSQDSGELVLF